MTLQLILFLAYLNAKYPLTAQPIVSPNQPEKDTAK